MNYDLLWLINQSKFLVQSPQLNETTPVETDPSLPMLQWERQINISQKYIQNLIVKSFKDYLGRNTTISLTSGTQTYSLPSNSIQVRLLERTDTDPDEKLLPFPLSNKYAYDNAIYNQESTLTNRYTIWGNNLYVVPNPPTATAQLWYIKRMTDLMYGTASSVTGSTIVFPSTPTFGTPSNEDDYYNGARLKIVSATTGAGQIQEITDYDAVTRTATVSWQNSITPTGTIKYSILSEIPEDYVELLLTRTAITMEISNKDSEAFNLLTGRYNEMEKDMTDGLSRICQENESIQYQSDAYYD